MDMSRYRSLQQGIMWLYSFKLEINETSWLNLQYYEHLFCVICQCKMLKDQQYFCSLRVHTIMSMSWAKCLEHKLGKEDLEMQIDDACLFPISQWYCPNGGGSVWEIMRNNRLSSPLDLALMVLRVARFDLHFPLVNSLFELTCLWCLFMTMIWVMG